ncbi:hypothetical protein QTG54_007350 [Skeletonema marinoi]|uniref:Borealin N-terminal domain-containing protein n=1 Tax=Skeletonema marinoi TaxID=267567 RepID=A0AAD9DBZ7_9STRA|nr:hypothetical protein QTG54_007350 [Skeletonema marinoi]
MTSLATMHHPAATQHNTSSEEALSTDQNIQWLNRNSCLAICHQRRQKLLEDEADLKEMRDQLMRSQKTTFVNGLCTLSRDVKKLTVKEFNDKFGCDVVDMIRKQLLLASSVGNAAIYEEEEDGGSSSGKKRNRVMGMQQQQQPQFSTATAGMMSLKTPAVGRFGAGRPPMTIARTARKGERLVVQSQNGSPIDQYDPGDLVITVKKPRRAANGKVIAPSIPINIGIGAGNGETIDLSDPNQRKNMDGEQKAHAMQQLMAMQEQMKNLMADW